MRGKGKKHATRDRCSRAMYSMACCALLAGALIIPCRAAPTPELRADEYQVKAAFLFHFLTFILEADERDPDHGQLQECTIAIIGESPFGDSFKPVEGRMIPRQHCRAAVSYFATPPKREQLANCRVAFISATEKASVGPILEALRDLPILTASDMEDFLEAGGMLRLVTIDDKVRWEINRTAVDEAGLRLNAQLLRSAIRVVTQKSVDSERHRRPIKEGE